MPSKKIVKISHQSHLAEALIEGIGDKRYQFPDGQRDNIRLDDLAKLTVKDIEIIPVPDQNIYEPIESTFEQCKVCMDREKDIKLEPCGHLLCHSCFNQWKISDQNYRQNSVLTCPFCRVPVKSIQLMGQSLKINKKKFKKNFIKMISPISFLLDSHIEPMCGEDQVP